MADGLEASVPTCLEIATAYQRGVSATSVLALKLGETRVDVSSNAPDLIDALAQHYQDFLDAAGEADLTVTAIDAGEVSRTLPFALYDDDVQAKEEFLDLPDGRVVRKRRTGIWLLFGVGGNYVLGPCRRHIDQVINAINARCADREFRTGALLFHASAVSMGQAGLAIAGLAGAGKSTLALEIMRHGASFVSNDRVLIGPRADGLVLTGLARMPRVNPGTLLHNDHLTSILTETQRAAYAALPPDTLRHLEQKYDVRIRDCFGPGRFRLRAALRALVVLTWQVGGGAMHPVWTQIADRPDLLSVFMKARGVFFEEGPLPVFSQSYRQLLAHCPLLVIEGGVDFPRAAHLCCDLMAEQSTPGCQSAVVA